MSPQNILSPCNLPCQVVGVSSQYESPEEKGDAEYNARDDGEDNENKEINEECDEGAETEDGNLDEDDEGVCDEPREQQSSLIEDEAQGENERKHKMKSCEGEAE